MPIVADSSFEPAWWLPGPHLQTLWPALFRHLPTGGRTRERLPTADGDFIDLDWMGPPSPAPLVILLHGLTGSSASSYIIGLQLALRAHGMSSVALNFRGCSGQPNHTARSYHSGDTEDLAYLYSILQNRFPDRPLAAVGFSLGGNVLLKWLGEGGRRPGLFAAAAVCVPLLLNCCADRMDRGFSRLYRNRLLRELKDYVQNKSNFLHRAGRHAEWQKLARLGDLSAIRSFWEYDDRVVAPLYGFLGVDDYYRQSSSRRFLSRIHCPTLIIHARDDPFMTGEILPSEDELSPEVLLEVSCGGGHVGFVSGGIPGTPRYWLEERIPAFLDAAMISCRSGTAAVCFRQGEQRAPRKKCKYAE